MLDSPEVLWRKINLAPCPRQCSEGTENGILAFFKFVVWPIRLQNSIDYITIANKRFSSYEEIQFAFENDRLTETELKEFLKEFLNNLMGKIREQCQTKEFHTIMEQAYTKEIKELEPYENNSEENPGMYKQINEKIFKDIFGSDQVILGQ